MMEKQIEEMAMTPLDVLANDIYQHCPDLAENYCGDTHCVACLAEALYKQGYRKQSEVIAEFTESVKHIVDGVKFKNANEKTAFMEMLEDLAMTKMKGGAE